MSIVQTGVALDPKLALDLLSRLNPNDFGVTKRVESKTSVDVSGTAPHEHAYNVAFARTLLEDPDATRLAQELLARYEQRRTVSPPDGARGPTCPAGGGFRPRTCGS